MAQLSNSIISLLTPQAVPKPNDEPLTVSQLVARAKQTLETNYRQVRVIGEISSFKPWRSGHWYFDLKDEQAVIPAVMFKQQCGRLKFVLEDGMQAILTGRVSLYAPQSKMQLIVDDIEPAGLGALALQFAQLKKKLEQEGLFDPKHKVALPRFPKVVGLVTSPQGAAIQDMLRILQQRFPGISVLVASTRVQGVGAAAEIADALYRLDATGECDVIVVGRGGGSLEDLWAFNEEVVARAIFAAKTPIVSAVGHETDFTIADFVADLRCATPTHAAQSVVPHLLDLVASLDQTENRIARQMRALIEQHHLRLLRVMERLRDPRAVVVEYMQRLDILSQRLWSWQASVHLNRARNRISQFADRIDRALLQCQKNATDRLLRAADRIEMLSPLKVIARGYAVAQKSDGSLLTEIAQVEPDEMLSIRLKDGYVDAVAKASRSFKK